MTPYDNRQPATTHSHHKGSTWERPIHPDEFLEVWITLSMGKPGTLGTIRTKDLPPAPLLSNLCQEVIELRTALRGFLKLYPEAISSPLHKLLPEHHEENQ